MITRGLVLGDFAKSDACDLFCLRVIALDGNFELLSCAIEVVRFPETYPH
jgi:hypothetical protein